MPKRTNRFQGLIALLEKKLASSGAQVDESKMLKDSQTGTDREVDIVIETKTGIHPIRIGIEVTNCGRPADIPWIEGIAQKHLHLPIDKSIVVSKNGFCKTALVKATALNIDALTIQDALKSDWNAKIDKIASLDFVSFNYPSLKSVKIYFEDMFDMTEFQDMDPEKLVLHKSSGEPSVTLRSFLEEYLHSPEGINLIQQQIMLSQEREFNVDGSHTPKPRSMFVLGPSSGRFFVSKITFNSEIKKEVSTSSIESGRYRDSAVILADGQAFGRTVNVAITEEQGMNPTTAIIVKGAPGKAKTKSRKKK